MAQNIINNFPKGGAIQVVYTTGAGSATSNATATDITGSATIITPTKATNLILVMASFEVADTQTTTPPQEFGNVQCVRDATVINGTPYCLINASITGIGSLYTAISFIYVDNPATTAATTYKFQQFVSASTSSQTITTANGTIVLMEIPG